jgi:hypothetical protein
VDRRKNRLADLIGKNLSDNIIGATTIFLPSKDLKNNFLKLPGLFEIIRIPDIKEAGFFFTDIIFQLLCTYNFLDLIYKPIIIQRNSFFLK